MREKKQAFVLTASEPKASETTTGQFDNGGERARVSRQKKHHALQHRRLCAAQRSSPAACSFNNQVNSSGVPLSKSNQFTLGAALLHHFPQKRRRRHRPAPQQQCQRGAESERRRTRAIGNGTHTPTPTQSNSALLLIDFALYLRIGASSSCSFAERPSLKEPFQDI